MHCTQDSSISTGLPLDGSFYLVIRFVASEHAFLGTGSEFEVYVSVRVKEAGDFIHGGEVRFFRNHCQSLVIISAETQTMCLSKKA